MSCGNHVFLFAKQGFINNARSSGTFEWYQVLSDPDKARSVFVLLTKYLQAVRFLLDPFKLFPFSVTFDFSEVLIRVIEKITLISGVRLMFMHRYGFGSIRVIEKIMVYFYGFI